MARELILIILDWRKITNCVNCDYILKHWNMFSRTARVHFIVDKQRCESQNSSQKSNQQ